MFCAKENIARIATYASMKPESEMENPGRWLQLSCQSWNSRIVDNTRTNWSINWRPGKHFLVSTTIRKLASAWDCLPRSGTQKKTFFWSPKTADYSLRSLWNVLHDIQKLKTLGKSYILKCRTFWYIMETKNFNVSELPPSGIIVRMFLFSGSYLLQSIKLFDTHEICFRDMTFLNFFLFSACSLKISTKCEKFRSKIDSKLFQF